MKTNLSAQIIKTYFLISIKIGLKKKSKLTPHSKVFPLVTTSKVIIFVSIFHFSSFYVCH